MKRIQYITTQRRLLREDGTVTENIRDWVENELKQGGIEVQLKKVVDLVAALTAKHLEDHPEELNNIIYLLDVDYCEQTDHKIIEEIKKEK